MITSNAPQITFYSKFALESESKELAIGINTTLQKVLLKFYLRNSNLVVGILHEDEIGNSTCIGCLYPAGNGRLYSNIGVGLLFYLCRKVDQDLNYR